MTTGPPVLPPVARRVLLAAGGLALLVQLVPSLLGGYGYFIDELYYLACARRLAAGYVDHPPLSIVLLRAQTALLGDSIPALRFVPALAGAALAVLTGLLARRLGGGTFAQALAALATLAPPVYLVMFGFYSMNALELVLWVLAVHALVSLVETGEPRRWLWFGLVAGLGLLNKHTMATLGGAAVVALLLTPERRLLRSRWLWLAGLLAFVLLLPNLVWQVEHGWPSLEFYRNAGNKNIPTPPLAGLLNQVVFMNPVTLPLWLGGLGFLLVARDVRRYRFLAFTYLLLLAAVLGARVSRPDRIGGIYPVLLAAGAVALERATARIGGRGLRAAAVAVLVVGAAALAPVGLPVLPPDTLARYTAFLGLVPPIERGEGKRSDLPQWFADRFGWPELVALVTRVVEGLPEEERRHAIVVAPSYGQAGALELMGRELPPVFSGHNNYFLWGLEAAPRTDARLAIVIGSRAEDLRKVFEEVEAVAVYRCTHCTRWRDDMPVYVARRPRRPLAEVWPRARQFG